jgi:hypothetical protein
MAAWDALCKIEQLLRDTMVVEERGVSCGGR